MARNKKKHIVAPKQTIKEDRTYAFIRFIPIILALILAGIPFMLGKYMELNTPGPFDSGSYVQSAMNILDGAQYGVDEISSARPGTLLVNIIGVKLFGYNDVGPKIVQALMQLAAFCLMFYTLKRTYGSAAAVVGVFIASFYLSAPVICKFGNVKEQYMIALVIITACGFILRQIGRRWWWLVIAGAAMINIYYFKATGLSVAIAIFIHLIAVLITKRRSVEQVITDVTFLLAGSVVGLLPLLIFHLQQDALNRLLGSLPVYMIAAGLCVVIPAWIIIFFLRTSSDTSDNAEKPLSPDGPPKMFIGIACAVVALILVVLGFKFGLFAKIKETVFASGGYLDWSRNARTYADQAKYVLRYYAILNLPVTLACLAIIIGSARFIIRLLAKVKTESNVLDTIALFMSVWWLLDMAFVWISPRPYEQYYLPLNASAAMLGGYVIWRFSDFMKNAAPKPIFVLCSTICVFIMSAMAWPVYAGLSKSPYSGADYPEKKRGYVQGLENVKLSKKIDAPWKAAGRYIKDNSTESDRMYVWGWMPGIYVQAQRLSAAKVASFSDMHVIPPTQLEGYVKWTIEHLKETKPKFIVDSRKRHYPNDRPPLELWPQTKQGFLPVNDAIIKSYDQGYAKLLTERIDADEAARYQAMSVFRQYIRDNYSIVKVQAGNLVLFVRKKDAG